MRILRILVFVAAVACIAVPLSSARVLDGGSLTISAPDPAEADSPDGHSMSYSVTETGYDVTCDGPGGDTATDTLSVTATFPIGDTTVICSATDGITGSFTVTVTDTTAPVIDQPGNVTEEATSPAGASVSYPDVNATDIVDGSFAASCSPGSGSTFALGPNTVTCNATDTHGNNATPKSFTVTVSDTTAPVIDQPSNVTASAIDSSGASVSYQVNATDNLDGSFAASCSPGSGSTFALGPTTVTCNATDTHGNAATPKSFTVTVSDTTAPVIDQPSNVTTAATGPSGASVTYPGVSATDNVDGTIAASCSPGTGTTFALGQTTVTCNATDVAGNHATPKSFTVTVSDTTAPVIPQPSNVTASAINSSGALVTYSLVNATDNVDGTFPASCSPGSGTTFALGPTTVTCNATDTAGNHATPKSFTVTVSDTTAPVITQPSNVTAEATGPSGAGISYPAVNATDNVNGTIAASCSPSSGSTFALGQTTVTCNATDVAGNHATPKSFIVTVADTTGPALTSVADIHREANSATGSIVNFTSPLANDLVDGLIPTVACLPASGTLFALGTRTVNCTASDSHGNPGTVSFQVSVVDTTPPVLIVPGDTTIYANTPEGVSAASKGGAAFLLTASASDSVDLAPTLTNNAPSFFPVGITFVTWTAKDASGNVTVKSAKLTVLPMPAAGTTPPALPPPPDRIPPDDVGSLAAKGGDSSVQLKWNRPKATDFDHAVVTRATADGSASPQVVYQGSGTSFVDKGLQNGVEYRYVVVAYDKAGNRSTGVAVVAVPKAVALLSPKGGAHIKRSAKKTTFRWKSVKDARYYNLQVYTGGELVFASSSAASKVLSVWPVRPSFVLTRQWKYAGKRYQLTPGIYTWYVWPGIGPRSAAQYGPLIGSSSFRIVR